MNVAFRVDASIEMGTGHLMRCLTLAMALEKRGVNCEFICRAFATEFTTRIRACGFKIHFLPAVTESQTEDILAEDIDAPSHASWLGIEWHHDADQTAAALSNRYADWLVVDHYALDARWERRVRPFCHRIMVIDDLADRAHQCDLLLDQNLGRTPADYKTLVRGRCTVLTGPRYALLRQDFANLRHYSLARRESPQLRRIVITMGGVDKDDATGQVLTALRECPLPAGCEIVVIMGSCAPWLSQVREQAVTMPWPTRIMVDIPDMAKFLADADLAIGASGTTAWERCCLGVPSISLTLAANQLAGAIALRNAGAHLLIEQGAELKDSLSGHIRAATRMATLQKISAESRKITDGEGASRVAELLTNEAH